MWRGRDFRIVRKSHDFRTLEGLYHWILSPAPLVTVLTHSQEYQKPILHHVKIIDQTRVPLLRWGLRNLFIMIKNLYAI